MLSDAYKSSLQFVAVIILMVVMMILLLLMCFCVMSFSSNESAMLL